MIVTSLWVWVLVMAMDYGMSDAQAQDTEWEDDLAEKVRRMTEECIRMYQNITIPGIDPDFHCPATFDGIMCWPPTVPGSQAELPCPELLDMYQTSVVRKPCLPSGVWEIHTLDDMYGEKGQCRCVHCFVLHVFSNLGYALSFTTCAIAFAIFLFCRSLWCTRNVIHWHLISSFMLKYIVFFIQPSVMNSASVHPKRIAAFLLYYFEETNYYWMFVEGLYLHTLVVFALRIDADKISFWVYCIIGWGIPLVFVGIWAIVSAVVNPEGDFMTSVPGENTTIVHEYACIIGPILLVLVINCFFLLNIVRLLMSKLRMQNNRSSDVKHYRRAARATLVLVVLLGVGYILILCQPLIISNFPPVGFLVFRYISSFLSGTQGLAVAIIYVFLNTEVRSVLRRKYRRQCGHSNSWLFRQRAKPRASSYSKYDDHTSMSTMRSVAHNDTVVDSCPYEDQTGRGQHRQGNRAAAGGGGAVKFTCAVANGDASGKPSSEEKVEIEVGRCNGNVAQKDRTDERNDKGEAEPLLEEVGNQPKPPATIIVSEASPVHSTSDEKDANIDEQKELNHSD